MTSKYTVSDFLYHSVGVLLGLSTFTLAPFLIFLWVGFEFAALVLVPLAMYLSFRLGEIVYDLAENTKTTYGEAMQTAAASLAVLVFLGALGFEVYDWVK